MKLKIKKGDTVKVISGKDKGKEGKVIQVFPLLEKVVVEKVNISKKHLKSRKSGEPGQTIEFAAPLHVSKVMLICPHCGRVTRVGSQYSKEGGKARICGKCKAGL